MKRGRDLLGINTGSNSESVGGFGGTLRLGRGGEITAATGDSAGSGAAY